MKNPARSTSPEINDSEVHIWIGCAATFSSSFDSCAHMMYVLMSISRRLDTFEEDALSIKAAEKLEEQYRICRSIFEIK